ncbi:MAG: hypothetical protein Q4G43_12690 [Mobilicoccus sp.]|nr:hypothetical protein [Mobilicoccus sp.]
MTVEAFDAALDGAIDRRGLSLGRIRSFLAQQGHEVSVSMLSAWRRGHAVPSPSSLHLVQALERVLAVPDGTLTGPLVDDLAPSAAGGRVGPVDLDDALGDDVDEGLVPTSLHDTVVLDEDGLQTAHIVRQCLVATAPDSDRFSVAFRHDDPGAMIRPLARSGCTIGREMRSGALYVVEFILPRTLETGESWATEFAVLTEGRSSPLVRWERTAEARLRFLHYTVLFDEAWVPEVARIEVEGQAPRTVRPVGTAVNVHLQDFGPGTATVSWSKTL